MKKLICFIVACTLMLGGAALSSAADGQEDIPKEEASVRVVPNYINSELISGIIFTGTAALMLVAIAGSNDTATTPSQHTPATHH